MFGDDQGTVSDSEDAQQIPVHKLDTVTSKYGLQNFKIQNKNNADPVRNKTVINGNTTEQISTFIYLCCSISQQNEKDNTVKISKFLQITEIINRTLKSSQVQKHTRLKIYNSLALLCYTDVNLGQLENRINTG